MQEMTQDVMQIIEDLQMTRYERKQNGVGEAEKDSYGYPFEPDCAFSTKPLEFVETAMRLDIEAMEMFSELSRLNRFSPLYYRLSGQFEKLLRQLGSFCITKAVIEQQENETFELLQDLTIEKLRKMAAFNFRKCFAAFMDSRSRGAYNADAFGFSIRWSALDRRLIATEEKIGKIKSSANRNQHEPMGTATDWAEETRTGPSLEDQLPAAPSGTAPVGTRRCQQVQSPMALAEKGRALPVLEGMVRTEPEGCRSELSAESINQQEPMRTASDVSEETRTGLSPLDQLPAAPSGTVPVDTTGCQQVQSPMALTEKGRALPVLGGMVRTDPEEGRSELSAESRNQQEPMGTATDGAEEPRMGLSLLDRLPAAPSGTGPVGTGGCQQLQSPMAQSEDEENQFMREILLGEALYRGDREAYETVMQTPDTGLATLWRDFLERDAQSSCSFLEKIGLFRDAPDDPPPEEEDWEKEKAFLPDLAVT